MKRKIRWRKDRADIKSAEELYEPHPNSKYKTCMVQHGFYGVDGSFNPRDKNSFKEERQKLEDWWLAFNGTRILPVMICETYPDIGEDGSDIDDTGGRQDLFFFIHQDDMETMFDRFEKFGSDAPRWLEDIYFNDQGHWYPEWVEEWA